MPGVLEGLVIGALGGAAHGELEKQLVIPTADLPGVAAAMRQHLITNQADPSLHNLTDAQCISLVKAADQAIIPYVLKRVGL